MQKLTLVIGAFVCGLVACERETLELEELSSAARDDADVAANVEPPMMMTSDAPAAMQPTNTACNDTDRDGVCDSLDNCPNHSNADQDPTACAPQPAAATCAALTAPMAPITTLPTVSLSKVSVGGKLVNGVLTVRKSTPLNLTLSVRCPISPGGGFLPLTMSAGFDQDDRGTCERVEDCPSEDAPVSFSLTVPSTPGPHYVKVAVHQETIPTFGNVLSACQERLDVPHNVIALCVTD